MVVMALLLAGQGANHDLRDKMQEWRECLIVEREHFRASREPVEAVVDAIMGGCYTEETRVVAAAEALVPSTARPDQRARAVDREMAENRRGMRLLITNYIVDQRLTPSE